MITSAWKVAAAKRIAEKWIGDAIKRPGRLREYFGTPEGENIPQAKINAEIAKLKKKESRTPEETS